MFFLELWYIGKIATTTATATATTEVAAYEKKKNNDQNEYVKTLVTSYTIMNIGLSSCHNVYNIKN